jgi:hypothetical protein
MAEHCLLQGMFAASNVLQTTKKKEQKKGMLQGVLCDADLIVVQCR